MIGVNDWVHSRLRSPETLELCSGHFMYLKTSTRRSNLVKSLYYKDSNNVSAENIKKFFFQISTLTICQSYRFTKFY